MTRTELERAVQPSLIDRLTDNDPTLGGDPPITREESVRRFRRSVQRDIEWLLNTRRTMYPAPDWTPEVRRSVYDFGLPDTTGIPVGTPAGQARLLNALKDTIERFEPRLANLVVRLVDADRASTPQLRFVIEATLLMDPSPEQVVFDTVLEVSREEYDVRDAGGEDTRAG
jgi:type VI secretion system protein ImpF